MSLSLDRVVDGVDDASQQQLADDLQNIRE